MSVRMDIWQTKSSETKWSRPTLYFLRCIRNRPETSRLSSENRPIIEFGSDVNTARKSVVGHGLINSMETNRENVDLFHLCRSRLPSLTVFHYRTEYRARNR